MPRVCARCSAISAEKFKIEEIRKKRLRRRDRMREALKEKPAPLFEDVIPPLFEAAHLRRISLKVKTVMLTLPPDRGLYLWGPVGCGKSYSMAALIRHYILSRRKVGRIRFSRLLREIRKCFGGSGGEGESAIIGWAEKVDKLFIEDLGLSDNPETDFAARTFYEILDYRIEHRLPVFITSNRPPEEIEKNFGERIGSRLRQACFVLPVGGGDKRRVI